MRNNPQLPGASLVAAVVFVLATAGCNPQTDMTGTAATDPDRTSTQSDPSGATTEPDSVRLPDGFPADFPLPPEFTITQGQFTEGSHATQANFLVRGASPASVTEIATFYHDQLPKAGYQLQQVQPIEPEMATALVYFHGDKFKDGSVQLVDDNGSTSVTISLPLRD